MTPRKAPTPLAHPAEAPEPEGPPRPPTLYVIPAGTPSAPCRGCRTAAVYWVKMPSGKLMPLRVASECTSHSTGHRWPTACQAPTMTTAGLGFPHWIDCPHAGRFTRKP